MNRIKIISAAPCMLVALGLLGCGEHASTAPVAVRPAPQSSDVNTFGESKDEGASNAERARAANYGSNSATPSTPPADSSTAPAPK
jgi:hypothetical protein